MKRREFIGLLGGTLTVWPVAALAQQRHPKSVIGFLGAASATGYAKTIASIQGGLADAGFVEGKNVAFEFRWAEGQFDRLSGLAAELVQREVAVIVTTGGPVPVRAAKAATSTIPIVFATGSDPVQGGLVPKLSGADGNVTGVTFLNTGLMPKRVEVLHEALPDARLFAALVNGKNPNIESDKRDISRAAAASGVKILFLEAGGQEGADGAFAEAAEEGGRRSSAP
jgi:putative ABC transport system substrate-binding protein